MNAVVMVMIPIVVVVHFFKDQNMYMFEKDNYFQNIEDTIDNTVELFLDTLEKVDAMSIQKRWTDSSVSDEMFSVRRISPNRVGNNNLLYLIGNTFTCDEVRHNWQTVALAGTDESTCVDWNRVEVVDQEELKIYLKKLISNWVDEILKLGDYSEEGKGEEDEIKDILHDMMFWDDRNPKWTAYDPNDKVNAVWLSQYKREEDREKLFEEIF